MTFPSLLNQQQRLQRFQKRLRSKENSSNALKFHGLSGATEHTYSAFTEAKTGSPPEEASDQIEGKEAKPKLKKDFLELGEIYKYTVARITVQREDSRSKLYSE